MPKPNQDGKDSHVPIRPDFYETEQALRRRIAEKLADYAKYNLNSLESCLLNILFDLMQEYQEEEYLNLLPVLLLKTMLGISAELYAVKGSDADSPDARFMRLTPAVYPAGAMADSAAAANAQRSAQDFAPVRQTGQSGPLGQPVQTQAGQLGQTKSGPLGQAWQAWQAGQAGSEAQENWLPEAVICEPIKVDGKIVGERVCIPVRGRYSGKTPDEHDREVRGLLVLYPARSFTEHELLFLEKFANRLGFAMHNNELARRNREHLEFVRNLVKDIGHNVLGPNMYFKLLINKLTASILNLGGHLGSCRADAEDLGKLKAAHLDLLDQINEIQQNFSHSSLFLESLLRESHFIQGRYVLRLGRVDIYERVLKAQFNSYLPLFKAKGIEAELLEPQVKDLQAGSFEAEADFGLISQVAANMFSNALKYATVDPAWPGAGGTRRKPFVRCGIESDARGDMRLYVLSSGERIRESEAGQLFDKYFRASNTGNTSGTGKGLHFVRDIMELHGGTAGYQATEEGNKFYFSIPRAKAEG